MRLAALLLLAACAPATPAWTMGSTTPQSRADTSLGGAMRIPTGDLRELGPDPSAYRERAEAAGLTPVAAFRYGVARGLDVGVMLAGTTLRFDLRKELGAFEDTTRPTWIVGVAPYVGWIPEHDDLGQGYRVGLEGTFARAVELGGLYEAWAGVRVGTETAGGRFAREGLERADAQVFGVRAGGLLGVSAGFRRVHAFLELTAAYEHWWGEHGETDLDHGGLVLIPSFGLRLRI
ncbi:MAG: hypothetical protein H6721_06125 [Sandaracinus sp.]|nr:hypothetical protein [Sandaracinus sp.]